jgi:hypothetical protein
MWVSNYNKVWQKMELKYNFKHTVSVCFLQNLKNRSRLTKSILCARDYKK